MSYSKTYVGAAVFFERPADDGWTEGEDGWPERTRPQLNLPRRRGGRLQKIRDLLRVRFVSLKQKEHVFVHDNLQL